VAQGVGLEFKAQYHKTKYKKKENTRGGGKKIIAQS
jgi:hypothetical protein